MNPAPRDAVPPCVDIGFAEPAEIRETHTGVVVLIGDRAYKAKKPVVTDFLDFSTVQSREGACDREVRLNSRIAADAYLGVGHLSDPSGGAAEPVVVMRRYPDAVRLASMVARGEPVDEHLVAVARTLARFHANAQRSQAIDESGTMPAIRARWEENLNVLGGHAGTILASEILAEVERRVWQFIDGRAVLIADRVSDHRIVDGHGDLIANDIFCLPDGPVLLDCLEFDDQLRYLDGLDDACFLAMDLEFLGRPDLSEVFLSEYRRHADDRAPAALAHFYTAYRAVVRAKVDCIRVEQGDGDAAADARRHLDLARNHLRAGTVRLVLVGGGPGTGKTTLARALGQELDVPVISSDDVRREVEARGDIGGVIGEYNAGLYSPDKVDAVYRTMLRRAGPFLASGRSVILDATWRGSDHRAWARDLARHMHSPIVELACSIPLDTAIARIESRQDSTSDADPRVAAAMALDRHSWSEARHIDTSRPLADSVAEAQEICCLAI
jgi:aminoglycoside phosphotransferase family enzyme/predicted kinase